MKIYKAHHMEYDCSANTYLKNVLANRYQKATPGNCSELHFPRPIMFRINVIYIP